MPRDTTPSATAPAGSRDQQPEALTPRTAARLVARAFDGYGIPRHPAEVRRQAARLVAQGHTDQSAMLYLRNALDVLDPTGETAAANVDRARGGAARG